jgi:hypothetical protein
MLLKILPFVLYTSPLSVPAFTKQIMPILHILCYDGSLVTWKVTCLTTAKFKPPIFSMSGLPYPTVWSCQYFHLFSLYSNGKDWVGNIASNGSSIAACLLPCNSPLDDMRECLRCHCLTTDETSVSAEACLPAVTWQRPLLLAPLLQLLAIMSQYVSCEMVWRYIIVYYMNRWIKWIQLVLINQCYRYQIIVNPCYVRCM